MKQVLLLLLLLLLLCKVSYVSILAYLFYFSRVSFLAYLFSRIFSRVSFLAYSLSLSFLPSSHQDRRLVELTLSCNHGALTLTNLDTVDVNLTRGDGELDAYITLKGPLDEINRALQDMAYQPDRNRNTHGQVPDM